MQRNHTFDIYHMLLVRKQGRYNSKMNCSLKEQFEMPNTMQNLFTSNCNCQMIIFGWCFFRISPCNFANLCAQYTHLVSLGITSRHQSYQSGHASNMDHSCCIQIKSEAVWAGINTTHLNFLIVQWPSYVI